MTRSWLAILVLMLGMLCLGSSSGCTTIYHDARDELPPDGRDRVSLRLKQAKQAASEALDEVQGVTTDLAASPPILTREEAGGVVESFGWELARRVDSVKDAVGKTGVSEPRVSEAIDRLTRAVRRLDASAQALSHELPEAMGSLADCREALESGIAATDEAMKALRSRGPASAGGAE